MGEIDQLRVRFRDLNNKFIAALHNLASTYPYAATYPDVPNEDNPYQTAQSLFVGIVRKLRNAEAMLHRIHRSRLAEAKELVESTDQLTASNATHMVRLQNYEDSAAGALGMYGDTRYLYNSTLIQTVGVGLAAGALVYSAATYRIT